MGTIQDYASITEQEEGPRRWHHVLPTLGKAFKGLTLLIKDPKCTYLVMVGGAAVVEKIRSVKTVRREEAVDEPHGAVALGVGMAFMR